MAAIHKNIAVTLIALSCACSVTKGDPNVTLLYYICNVDTSITWAYDDSINTVLQDIVDKTSSSGYNYYSENTAFLTQTCYGHGACNGVLANPDCDACMSDAKQLIRSYCPKSIGAQVQLQDCRIRYENYQFHEACVAPVS